MKIVALHTDFRLYWPKRLTALRLKFAAQGHELDVVEIAGEGSLYAFTKSNVIHPQWQCLFPDKRIEDLNPHLAKKVVKAQLDVLNPDIIVSGAFAFTSGAAALDWAKAHNKAVVIFDDSKTQDVPRNFFVNSIKKMFYSYADAIVCPTIDWLQTFAYWGFKREAVFFGMNVVDNAFWEEKTNAGLPFQLPARYLLCVGRQIHRKNFHTVIKAFTLFKTHHPDSSTVLVFVGEGEEREALQKLISNQEKKSVLFLPFLNPPDLRLVYQNALALILPSYAEQWGMVVNEAMASGCPVIVSKQCGCSNALVHNDVNGFTFNATDPVDLASIIHKIDTTNDKAIRKMREKSREIISQWDLDRFCKGIIEACDYAIQHKRRPFYIFGKFLLHSWDGRYNIG